MTLLKVFESIVLAGWGCMALCGILLSLISWVVRRREAPLISPRHLFAIILPVEGTEADLSDTLEYLRQINYPRGMFDVVVAPLVDTDQMSTIAKQKGVVVHAPNKRKWRNREEAVSATLERLTAKSRYEAFVILDTSVRISPEFLSIMSDKLSKGALIVQSGYRLRGDGISFKTGLLAILYAFSPSWFAVPSNGFQIGGELRRVGTCLSRRLIERYGVRQPFLPDMEGYMLRLLRENVVVIQAPQAIAYDGKAVMPPPRPLIALLKARWRTMRREAMPLIREGLTWENTTQVLGGVTLMAPPFSLLLIGASLFFGLAVSLHGTQSALSLGWASTLAAFVALAFLKLASFRAPAIAYAALPVFPLYAVWRQAQTWIPTGTEISDASPVSPPEDTAANPGGSSRRRSSRRNQQRLPSFGKGEASDPA